MTRQEFESRAKDNYEKIYKMYLEGMNKKEIAKKVGYSEGYVDLLIRKMKGSSERRVMSDDDKKKVIKFRKEGKTIKEIATEVGFSMSAVQKCLKDHEEIKEDKQPEEMLASFATADKKPQTRVAYINGKRYRDVSEFYLGV